MARKSVPAAAPQWERIDTVLLDMDGTLLDLHFDDHFWLEHVPGVFARRREIGISEAKEELFGLYRSREGTLSWTDLDFWSEQLDLDIPALKRQVRHLIAVHPHVTAFLDRLRQTGKEIWLVTDAHGKTLDLKMENTALEGKFHGTVTSHEIGFPKADLRFWREVNHMIPFDPRRSLLAEDTTAVLETACAYGIRYLVQVTKFSSTRPPGRSGRFFCIERFSEIMPP